MQFWWREFHEKTSQYVLLSFYSLLCIEKTKIVFYILFVFIFLYYAENLLEIKLKCVSAEMINTSISLYFCYLKSIVRKTLQFVIFT